MKPNAEDILINVTPYETRVAIVIQGSVQELHVERGAERGLVGNLYLGRVQRVLPGMQSAFIDIGLERAAFLHVADIFIDKLGTARSGRHDEPLKPIEKILHEGQSLLVQVIKDPIGSKGARLSTQLSIAGRMLVYLPQDPHIGISQKIGNEAERSALRERVQKLAAEARGANGQPDNGGFIVRTQAEDASDAELAADIAFLRKTWLGITAGVQTQAAPALLYQDLSLTQRVLRDIANDATVSIQVDSRWNFQQMTEFGNEFTPGLVDKLVHYRGERPLFDVYGIDEEIEKALGRRVDLKSGGYLIIDQTEAMTTIDVNTGGYVGVRSFDDTIFKTNLEAAQSIARQLRLRNLGGIIIVDFIDMQGAEHRDSVIGELRKALARDRVRTTVNGFSQLGLVELTRKRTRESLAHMLCEPCPTCAGRGEVKTPRTVCYEILREILREARQFNPKEFRILASQGVIDLFLEEESQNLAALGDFIGKPVSLAVEALYSQEQYDIILM
ncbi:ribonuclease G [Derxia lacustris]|uniref:ribonuclease G n=1 Tax=Derxia lacustris TaxID=764842 RepID=UPI000A173122|nr:ribonuclease G [Derxia lacustris]